MSLLLRLAMLFLLPALPKGRGFQGVVKRHGFQGGRKSHGNKNQLRMPGSVGHRVRLIFLKVCAWADAWARKE